MAKKLSKFLGKGSPRSNGKGGKKKASNYSLGAMASLGEKAKMIQRIKKMKTKLASMKEEKRADAESLKAMEKSVDEIGEEFARLKTENELAKITYLPVVFLGGNI
ncbi:putative golgin subfamily A member 8I-like protein [Corchorus olitorius]|uniref:Golgin subfamily A member 8I-like protein n=1 Tax=Corchorus olitorius TaxID=93759 RepID=A0A1R3L4H4_9ROSI|nr:putative golgin subfamily A member 8I-like protein [Corchorus olitorius]